MDYLKIPKMIQSQDFPIEMIPKILCAIAERVECEKFRQCAPEFSDEVAKQVEGKDKTTIVEVLDGIGANHDRSRQSAAGIALRGLGFKPKKEMIDGKRIAVYRRKGSVAWRG